MQREQVRLPVTIRQPRAYIALLLTTHQQTSNIHHRLIIVIAMATVPHHLTMPAPQAEQ